MENQSQIHIDGTNVNEVVIRHGEAPEIHEPVRVSLNGSIEAPREFFRKRYELHEAKDTHVIYSKDKLFVELRCNEKEFDGATIRGELKENEEIKSLGINQEKTFTHADLLKKLKFMRRYFKEIDGYNVLIDNLQKLKVNVQRDIQAESDNRGNKTASIDVKVKTETALNFTMKTNLYKGLKEVVFQVDICCDVRENTMSLWLESVEMKDLQTDQRNESIGNIIEYFDSFNIVCIEQ